MYGILPARMPNIRGLVGAIFRTTPWQPLIIAAISLLVLLWVARQASKFSTSNQLVTATLASALVSYHGLIHDWTILLVALCAVEGSTLAAALLFMSPLLLVVAPDYFFLGSIPLFLSLFLYAKQPRWIRTCDFQYEKSAIRCREP
jgi:hypothetical protein